VAVDTIRGGDAWPRIVAAAIVAGTLGSAVMMAFATLPAPGWVMDPTTHIPTGELIPGYLRLLTPLFNVTGAFALSLGAIFSAYIFMPKRRLIGYSLDRHQPLPSLLANLLRAPVAIAVNLVGSLPGAAVALVSGRLNSRVPATILIAIGGFIPAVTSGLSRFGSTGAFFVGELLGVVFLLAGFLASIEVFAEIRIPFTSVVFRARREPDAG